MRVRGLNAGELESAESSSLPKCPWGVLSWMPLAEKLDKSRSRRFCGCRIEKRFRIGFCEASSNLTSATQVDVPSDNEKDTVKANLFHWSWSPSFRRAEDNGPVAIVLNCSMRSETGEELNRLFPAHYDCLCDSNSTENMGVAGCFKPGARSHHLSFFHQRVLQSFHSRSTRRRSC